MSALDETQLARMRRDLGDNTPTPAFPDAELQDLWTEEGEDWNKAVARGYLWLLSDAAKFADYTANESSEEKSQIFKNLQTLYGLWKDKAAAVIETQAAVTPSAILPIRAIWRSKSRP